MLRGLIILLALVVPAFTRGPSRQPMRLGVDADNWSGQTQNREFEQGLRRLKVDFISWHISPDEEKNPDRLSAIVEFCRRNHWSYLFNTELANYQRHQAVFMHQDGSYRYDLAEQTLSKLKDDPLFLGVIYDEAELMQALCGVKDEKGDPIQPYFADTSKLPPSEAFLTVVSKVTALKRRYERFGKRLIFEMTFPDYPFAFARAGGLLAPKLLKENYNDLMYAVYRGAALEYESKELWACVDLWFLDKFPFGGKYGEGYHTPEQLLHTLQFAYTGGFDYVYIEQVKGLLTESYELSSYGEKVVDFDNWRLEHKHGDWRTAPIDYYVKRIPDGYWGQDYSSFIPDHPYGSWTGNPYRRLDKNWFQLLHKLSNGVIPDNSDSWNASRNPQFNGRPYRMLAGLPPMVVFDQFGDVPLHATAKVLDFSGTSMASGNMTIH